jgi:hypothetical protein
MKKGYKKAYIIKDGMGAMQKAGFIWVEKDNIPRKIGPDGKVKHLQ